MVMMMALIMMIYEDNKLMFRALVESSSVSCVSHNYWTSSFKTGSFPLRVNIWQMQVHSWRHEEFWITPKDFLGTKRYSFRKSFSLFLSRHTWSIMPTTNTILYSPSCHFTCDDFDSGSIWQKLNLDTMSYLFYWMQDTAAKVESNICGIFWCQMIHLAAKIEL